MRLQLAFHAMCSLEVKSSATLVLECTDLFAYFQQGPYRILLALLPEQLVSVVQSRCLPWPSLIQVVIVTWSGLLWLRGKQESPIHHIAYDLRTALCKEVLHALSRVVPLSGDVLSSNWCVHSPSYITGVCSTASHCSSFPTALQGRVAWLMHMLPEAKLLHRGTFAVYIPSDAQVTP
jgi:hypothetical protein